ncbi:MAG: chemotaxis response regulator protein-glutamate methylesterase [Campylobacterales bacterium]|nr:chemotaxis response regulator protein-glutamate methylesterase [Campylobacterales bacterium]
MAIRVLIVDDSATARAVVKEILEESKDIEVVGVAADAFIARDKIVQLAPDVVCLDVEMPRMDGLTFLRKLMKHKPTPVVMVSSLTQKGAQVTLDALEAGAVDFVGKPHSNIYDGADDIKEELIAKVKAAAKAKVTYKESKQVTRQVVQSSLAETTKKIIVIGASTGGTEALKEVLTRMPRNSPGIVIVQHMPGSFTGQFASRLNALCEIDVKEAKNGDNISVGQALIAPGDYHMVVRRSGHQYFVEIGDGHLVSGHKPSVDVLFNSASKSAGANAVGIILTGMGADGAKGMLNLHKTGAKTIAQDKKTCVVFGMPKVAIDLGGVDEIIPLEKIPEKAIKLVEKMG